jgi:hypothetical protein
MLFPVVNRLMRRSFRPFYSRAPSIDNRITEPRVCLERNWCGYLIGPIGFAASRKLYQ